MREQVEGFFKDLPAKLGGWIDQAAVVVFNWLARVVGRVRTTLLMIGAILAAKMLLFIEKSL